MRYFLFSFSFIFSVLLCSAEERPLKVNDVIQLSVFGEASLGGQVTIDSSGLVSFPLVNNVEVVGKTTTQIAEEVKNLLEKDYIKNADVTVSVVSEYVEEKPKEIIKYRDKPVRQAAQKVAPTAPAAPLSSVVVMGEVKAPGTVRFEGSSADILTIIAQVRGLTPAGNPRKVSIRRVGEDANIFTVDVNKLQSSTEPFYVQSGDTITVKRRHF